MSGKIQEVITSIYDWMDSNQAFKVINKATHFCSTDRFLYHTSELHSLLTKARILLNEFSEHVEKINLCTLKLHEEIDSKVSKKCITEEALKLLLKDKNIQVKIKDLLIVAKRLQKKLNSKDRELKTINPMTLEDAKTLSSWIITKFGD